MAFERLFLRTIGLESTPSVPSETGDPPETAGRLTRILGGPIVQCAAVHAAAPSPVASHRPIPNRNGENEAGMSGIVAR